MKAIKILVFLFLGLSLSFGCRMKNACELNHTGEISITNKTGQSVEVYIENIKVFSLENLQTKTIDKPIGNYEIKCLNFPNEWMQTVIVEECKTSNVQFPELED
ncbi:MAG: hypothetical protein GX793_04610 [Bacteroidales bacterium]|jgi:hypothetical protein|nr:hypothetical protein [Bacteroidales bacterium]MCK9497979.1 hypothetical protein [Bacteroidales bacterium]MDY0314686.1 hypothetical protein [Bacteroidales bacterium]NLB86326.1 hypothetical protein [Bacteroidales bacterium]